MEFVFCVTKQEVPLVFTRRVEALIALLVVFGWSGRAMVVANFPSRGVLLIGLLVG